MKFLRPFFLALGFVGGMAADYPAEVAQPQLSNLADHTGPGLAGRLGGTYRRVIRTERPPVIDGVLDDACWQNAVSLGPFLVLGQATIAEEQTEVFLAWDDTALYIACRAFSANLDALKAAAGPERNSNLIFRDDTIEIYLKPEPGAYWQIAVNADNAVWDATVAGTSIDVQTDLPLQSATSRDPENGAWILELAVPFAALHQRPQPGDIWRFNIGRDHAASGSITTFAPLPQRRFHQPENFARLLFTQLKDGHEPVLQLDFEEGHGSGRLIADAELAAGRDGTILKLNGKGWLELPRDPLLLIESQFTLAAWVRPYREGGRILDKCTAGTNNGYTLELDPRNHVRFITPFGTAITEQKIPLQEWTHISAVLDLHAGRLNVYLNGNAVAEAKAETTLLFPILQSFRIGADSNGNNRFSGEIDDVYAWRRSLTAQEIEALLQ